MDIDTLKTFVDVVHHGSFAAAARASLRDPSAISRTIGLLETELGLRLFQRTTRRLALTEGGEAYFERVLPLVSELDAARDAALDFNAQPAGRLRVTTATAFGEQFLTPRLLSFRERYPAIGLELILCDQVLDLVAERLDLAIRIGPQPSAAHHVVRKLVDVVYRVCASPAYLDTRGPPPDPAALARLDCPRYALQGFSSSWQFRSKASGRTERVAVQGSVLVNSARALREFALAGVGPVLLAHWMIDEDLAAGRLVNLFPDHEVTATEFDASAWLMYPSRAHQPRKLRLLIDHLVKPGKR